MLLEKQGSDAQDRSEAALLLAHLASEGADRKDELRFAIPRLLEDPQPEVRRVAATLAAIVLPEAEGDDFLRDRLKDPAEVVRIEAAGQLADRARPELRPALAAALTDASFLV